MNLISSGGLRPPQQQVEYKSSLIIIEFAALVAAEAGNLRYYINLSSYKGRRTESNRTADGIRSGGERYTMTIREQTIKNLYCSMSRNTPLGFVGTRLQFVFQ